MRIQLKKVIFLILGWIFMLLGLLGIVLPVWPGILFFFIGLTLLSSSNQWSKKLLESFRHRFPSIAGKTDQFLKKLRILRR